MNSPKSILTKRLKATQKVSAENIAFFEGQLSCQTDARFEIGGSGLLGDSLVAEIERELVIKILTLTKNNSQSLEVFMTTCLSILLSKLTGKQNFLIGNIDVKHNVDREHVYLLDIDGTFNQTFKEKLFVVKRNYEQALQRGSVGLDVLRQSESGIEVDTILLAAFSSSSKHGERIQPADNFPLLLEMQSEKDCIILHFSFSNTLKIRPHYFVRGLVEVIRQSADNPLMRCKDIEILNTADSQILSGFSQGIIKDFHFANILEMFACHVTGNGANPALFGETGVMTFNELNDWAVGIAKFIQTKFEVQRGDVIAIVCGRTPWHIGAMLATLKLGCTFVTIDPDIPSERIRYMVDDSNAMLVVCDTLQSLHYKKATQWNATDKDLPINTVKDFNFFNGEESAYIIYSSGTTGKPKGTPISHRSFLNMVLDQITTLNLSREDKILQFASASFDASLFEIFLALLSGATLVQISRDIIGNPFLFQEYIETKGVTYMNLPPVYLGQLDKTRIKSVKKISVSGEIPELTDLKELESMGVQTFNIYGPSETAVVTSVYRIHSYDSEPVPIGKPMNNTTYFILNEQGNILPLGVTGELFIGGINVGRGYLNLPQLTDEKFVDNPFGEGKLYRTGDSAYWREDGEVVLKGRTDDQIKIRGHRIEPHEVQLTLSQLKGVHDAVVIPDKRSGVYELRAFYTSEENVTPEIVREGLAQFLPSYMIPVSILEIEKIPLTYSGKVDRIKILSAWDAYQDELNSGLLQAENETEADIQETWNSVLKRIVNRVDNFFHIGGDSIKAIQVTARLHKKGYGIIVRDIFNNPTVAQLSKAIEKTLQQGDFSIVHGTIPLSPIQEWFFREEHEEPWHFNQSVIISLKKNWPSDQLRSIVKSLLEHHDALRITFSRDDEKVIQYNHASAEEIPIHVYDLRHVESVQQEIQRISAASQRTLLLDKCLLRFDHFIADKHYLGITIHHLITDGVSWNNLLGDLDQLLTQGKAPFQLAPKSSSWKRWCEMVNSFNRNEEILSAIPAPAKLVPLDYAGNSNLVADTRSHAFTLDRKLSIDLDSHAHSVFGTTSQDLLVAALGKAICQQWNLTAIAIDMESHGRFDEAGLDVSKTVGWFTNIYSVVLEDYPDSSLDEIIISAKESIRLGYQNSIAAFLTNEPIRNLSTHNVLFNYLGAVAGQEFNEFEISGIATGPTLSPRIKRGHDLEVNALIIEDQLHVNLTYGSGQFKNETVSGLAESMKEILIDLVNYCTSATRRVLTPSDLTFRNFDSQLLRRLQKEISLQDIYPLTPIQEGIFYHHLFHRDFPIYFTQIGYVATLQLNVELFSKAFSDLANRHEILRASIIQDVTGKPFHIIRNDNIAEFIVENISHLSDHEVPEYLESAKRGDRKRNFNFEKDVMLRIKIFLIGKDQYYFLWSYHHIIVDGWSVNILATELMRLYLDAVSNKVTNLAEGPKFGGYLGWLGKLKIEKSYEYWKIYLSDYRIGALLPKTNCTMEFIDLSKRKDKSIELTTEQTQALMLLSLSWGVTLNVLMEGIWSIVLSKYGNTNDVVFGTVVSGRPSNLSNVESTVGLFINNIPVRAQIMPADSFSSLLMELQKNMIEAEVHQYCALPTIQRECGYSEPLFDHILLFENFPVGESPKKSEATVQNIAIGKVDVFDVNNYAFTLVVIPGEHINVRINFNDDIHPERVVEEILSYIKTIVTFLESKGDVPIAVLQAQHPVSLPMSIEKNQALGEKTILDFFRESLRRFPQMQAITGDEQTLSYAQLDNKSDQLAAVLLKKGVTPGEPVGLHFNRSPLAFVSIWAILKARACYVPIEPSWPDERKNFILHDAHVHKVLCVFNDYPELKGLGADPIAADILSESHGQNVSHGVQHEPRDIAYIIYTSGSTGKPKGVPISHRNLVNMVVDQMKTLDLKPGERMLQFAPLFFDASVYEWAIAFFSGATLVLPPDKTLKNAEAFVQFVEASDINMVTLPPPFFNLLEFRSKWPTRIVLAGSAPDPSRSAEASKFCRCFNAYGPTETTVCISIYEINPRDKNLLRLPIGKPLAGNTVYVLDEQLSALPNGVEGELFISGENVSSGYIGRHSGKGSFINDPFCSGNIMYRTGDRGRWLSNNLEFFGRIDRQVKRNGYRIELGEIESAMLKLSHVQSAHVISKMNIQDVLIIAYVVASQAMDERKLRDELKLFLPTYLHPDQFLLVENLPLTAAGKIDVTALACVAQPIDTVGKKQIPVTSIETTLYNLWKDNLQRVDFGTSDKYFELGGNSLSLIRIHSQIKAIYPQVSVTDIFQYNTIEEMADYISKTLPKQRSNLTLQGTKLPLAFLDVKDNTVENEGSFECEAGDWENLKIAANALAIDDDDLVTAFFMYAIHEVSGQSDVTVAILNIKGTGLAGTISVNFTAVNTRDDLFRLIAEQRKNIVPVGDEKDIDGFDVSSAEGEVVIAVESIRHAGGTNKFSGGIGILLTRELKINGDFILTLRWNNRLLKNEFMNASLESFKSILENLIASVDG